MVRASIEKQKLVLELQGLSRFSALKRRLDIPLDHVRAAHSDASIAREWLQSLRGRPLIRGTFYQDGSRMFWDVTDGGDALVIDANGERYDQLVVQVANPGACAQLIAGAIARGPAAPGVEA
jgi:hypothetical protein